MSRKKKKTVTEIVTPSGRLARRMARTKTAPRRNILKIAESRRKGRIRALVNKCF